MADVSTLMRNAEEHGEVWCKMIEGVARYLADQMQDVHGGKWRVQIEHEDGLIVIARRCRT